MEGAWCAKSLAFRIVLYCHRHPLLDQFHRFAAAHALVNLDIVGVELGFERH